MSTRSLTVFCRWGLSNRIKVLVSGIAIAEATGRDFQMLWPVGPDCACPFEDLFTNAWNVQTVRSTRSLLRHEVHNWFGHLPDLLKSEESAITVGYASWLIKPQKYAEHTAPDSANPGA